jgi:ADP-ribose pyrophosphatase YjhB (NUDIX family)
VVERVVAAGDGAYHYVILDYLARPTSTAAPRPGDDARAARFVDAAELARLPLTAGLRPVIERARALAVANSAPPR